MSDLIIIGYDDHDTAKRSYARVIELQKDHIVELNDLAATSDLLDDFRSDYVALARESAGIREYLMPPPPNTLYTQDTTCWLHGGVTLNPRCTGPR
jgi:arginine deiminase